MTFELKTDEELQNVTGGTKITYLVQDKDTLSDLANKFHCTIEDLCRWNGIENSNILSVGQKLIVKF